MKSQRKNAVFPKVFLLVLFFFQKEKNNDRKGANKYGV